MLNIIIYKIKRQFTSVSYYAIALFLYILMLTAIYPSMEKVDLSKIYSTMPKEFLNFFGGTNISDLSKYEGFVSLEFLSIFFILIVAFYIASSAGSIIAGSIEKKTMDFQLSQPISRTKLVLSEELVGILYTTTLVAITTLSMLILCLAYKIDISTKGLLAFAVTASVFLYAFYGIALLFSALLKNKITVASITLSLIMASYVFTAMTNIVEKLKDYDRFSIFYVYNPKELLASGNIHWNHIVILLSLFLLTTLSAIFIFNRKDI